MPPWGSLNRPGRRLDPPRPKPKARPKPKPKPKARPKRPTAPPRPAVDPLDEQVQAATEQAYRQPEQEIQGQRDVNAQMAVNIPAWYADYRAALANATRATSAAYGAAVGVQQNAAATSSALDAQQRAAGERDMRADAAQRGTTVDPALLAQGQQAGSARRAMLDAFTGLTATQGAAQTSFRAGQETVAVGQETVAKEKEAGRRRAIDREAVNLGREKGQYAVTTRQKLLDAQHQRDLENKAFGLDVEKAKTDAEAKAQAARDRAAARRTANRNADQSRDIAAQRESRQAAADRRAAAKDAYQRRNKLGPYAAGGGGKSTNKDAAKVRTSINTAAADARTLRNTTIQIEGPDGKPTGKTRKPTESEIRAKLRSRYKDADVANAAMDIAINGYISAENERRLRARGIRVPSRWRQSATQLAVNPGRAAGMSSTRP